MAKFLFLQSNFPVPIVILVRGAGIIIIQLINAKAACLNYKGYYPDTCVVVANPFFLTLFYISIHCTDYFAIDMHYIDCAEYPVLSFMPDLHVDKIISTFSAHVVIDCFVDIKVRCDREKPEQPEAADLELGRFDNFIFFCCERPRARFNAFEILLYPDACGKRK
jgi:hypothetical protein